MKNAHQYFSQGGRTACQHFRGAGETRCDAQGLGSGLGCSGFRYGLGIEDREPERDDTIFDANGIRVVIDPQSLSYMDGSTVDWVEDPQNGGFAIANPNPAPEKECGCGGACGTASHGTHAEGHGEEESAGASCDCGGTCDCQQGQGTIQ